MDAAVVLARWVHVVTGVYWIGAVFFIGIFLGPAVEDAGPGGGAVMAALLKRKYFEVIATAATLTIISGLFLVWVDSAHFDPAWFGSKFGATLSAGMAAAIIAYLVALAGIRPAIYRMQRVAKEMASQGPTPELIASAGALRLQLHRVGKITSLLLLIAVSAMAVARYL